MSLSSGFFNSSNGDRRYSAEQMSAIFDGVINDGIFASVGTAFEVLASSGTEISVGEGRAWFNSTWIYNDSAMLISLEAAEVLQDRYDAVVIEVDRSESVRDCDIKIVKGTPSTSPLYPALKNTGSVHQYPLAFILRKANSTSVTQADIINSIGMDYCPYVTGILQVQSIEKNVAQWKAQWDEWFNKKTSDVDKETSEWMSQFKTEVEDWFESIEGKLGKDPAVELANDILALESDMAKKVGKSGDTMTGPLKFNKSSSNGTSSVDRDETVNNYHGLWLMDSNAAGRKVGIRICAGTDVLQFLKSGTWYNLYGEHNKPTATDVGALPSSGGSLSGALNIDNKSEYTGVVKSRTVNSSLYKAIMGVGSDNSRGASASFNLTNPSGSILGRIDIWSNGTLTFFDGSDYHDLHYANGGKFAAGSYTGAGTNGTSNANTLSFQFKPKIIFVLYEGSGNNNPITLGVILASAMTTSYTAAKFATNVYFDASGNDKSVASQSYGKLSSDGKTVSWYSTGSAQKQMNASEKTYYYYAIGL